MFPRKRESIQCEHRNLHPIEEKTILRAYCLDCGAVLYKKGRFHGGRKETTLHPYKCQHVARVDDGSRRYICTWTAVWWSGANAFCPLHIPKTGHWITEEKRLAEKAVFDQAEIDRQKAIDEQTRIIREAALSGTLDGICYPDERRIIPANDIPEDDPDFDFRKVNF